MNNRVKWIAFFLFTVMLVLLSVGCSNAEQTVATVGEEEITEKQFANRLKTLYGKEVLDEMINKKVVFSAAKRYGIKADPNEINREFEELRKDYDTEEDFTEYLKEQMGWTKQQLLEYIEYYMLWEEIATKDVVVSEQKIEEYYHDNADLYTDPEKFFLEQIVVKSEKEAQLVMEELQNGSDFNTLAKERSIDVFTASNGGEIGMVTSDDQSLALALRNKMKELDINEPAIAKVQEGYAIIRVTKHVEGTIYPLKEVENEIRRELALEQVPSLTQVLDQLKKEMQVNILDEQLKKKDQG